MVGSFGVERRIQDPNSLLPQIDAGKGNFSI
jgi:hypothetical protein